MLRNEINNNTNSHYTKENRTVSVSVTPLTHAQHKIELQKAIHSLFGIACITLPCAADNGERSRRQER